VRDRKEERVLISKDVIINDTLKAQAFDISEGGMYLHTQEEFNQGAIVELSFDIDNSPIKVMAMVRHIQSGVGIGVRFIGLSREDSLRIKKLLQMLSHVSPPAVYGKKKVLLVDCDARSRSVYKTRLLRDDFTVIEASNDLEAIKLLKNSRPDIVVLDFLMEGVDSFRILELMQMDPDLKIIPVLILSSRSIPADVEKATALSVKDFSLKMTTTPVQLSEKIKELLGVR
jgi:CheY-like chemotaxis protein